MVMNAQESASTRPYLIRALYEWCSDNGFTPYVAVMVDDSVQVPREYVKNGEIVLNVSFDATSSLKLGNEFIEFKARFGGQARDILVPVTHVLAIYARENGQGMAFPVAVSSPVAAEKDVSKQLLAKVETLADGAPSAPSLAGPSPDDPEQPSRPPTPGRPALKRIK